MPRRDDGAGGWLNSMRFTFGCFMTLLCLPLAAGLLYAFYFLLTN